MGQFILLNTYCGLSDFTFEVDCNGRSLPLSESLERGLVTIEQLRGHKESSYTHRWFEVGAGDTFTVRHHNDDSDPVINTLSTFRVPVGGMPQPNTDIDNMDATFYQLEQHLREQCELLEEHPYL